MSGEIKPTRKDIFIATAGQYIGQMFVVIEIGVEEVVNCFAIPTNTIHKIPMESFMRGIEGELLNKVETLPNEHFDTINELYEEHSRKIEGGCDPIASADLHRSS
jgi:hypothetical protein